MKYFLPLIMVFLMGCMAKVTVDKRPNLAFPIYSESSKTNPVEYVIVDQGYEVKYTKWGFSTVIDSMSAEITTNKTVNFQLGGLHSIAPTNSISIRLDDLLKIASLLREADGCNPSLAQTSSPSPILLPLTGTTDVGTTDIEFTI